MNFNFIFVGARGSNSSGRTEGADSDDDAEFDFKVMFIACFFFHLCN